MDVRNEVVYFTSPDGALPIPRHSLKRLQMLSVLTKSGNIAYQENEIITVYIQNPQFLASFETKDPSFKIYPVVTDTEKYIKRDQESIQEYCLYKINFYHTYKLNVFTKETTLLFEACTKRARGKIWLLMELYQLRKHAQDLIVSKTLDRAKVEGRLITHLQTFS